MARRIRVWRNTMVGEGDGGRRIFMVMVVMVWIWIGLAPLWLGLL